MARAAARLETAAAWWRLSPAIDRLLPRLSNVRAQRGADKWTAICPVCGKNKLGIKHAGDRVLIKCWIGCTAADIVAAAGLRVADLFDRHDYKPDPAADFDRQAVEAFLDWQDCKLQQVAEELRWRDARRALIGTLVEAQAINEDVMWSWLANVYDGYSELEQDFDTLQKFNTLRKGTVQEALELWREST
jgi:hypothetical protein